MNSLFARRNLYLFFHSFLALLTVAGTVLGQATANIPSIYR
jgi:hypothetical protein